MEKCSIYFPKKSKSPLHRTMIGVSSSISSSAGLSEKQILLYDSRYFCLQKCIWCMDMPNKLNGFNWFDSVYAIWKPMKKKKMKNTNNPNICMKWNWFTKRSVLNRSQYSRIYIRLAGNWIAWNAYIQIHRTALNRFEWFCKWSRLEFLTPRIFEIFYVQTRKHTIAPFWIWDTEINARLRFPSSSSSSSAAAYKHWQQIMHAHEYRTLYSNFELNCAMSLYHICFNRLYVCTWI